MKKHIFISKLEDSQLKEYADRTFKILAFLKNDYPDFEKWYWDKVIPDVKNCCREIIIIEADSQIAAVSILKKEECKICCLMVLPEYQRNGLGKELLETSMKFLQTAKPYLTVSSRRIQEFMPLFNEHGFQIYEEKEDLYISGVTEYAFNGTFSTRKERCR